MFLCHLPPASKDSVVSARLVAAPALGSRINQLVTARETAAENLRRWAASGAMWLTGPKDGAPATAGFPVAAAAFAALESFKELAGDRWTGGGLDGGRLLTERAAIAGLQRGGRVSAGGAARLLRCADGWLCLNLAREDDLALLPAWLELEIAAELVEPGAPNVASSRLWKFLGAELASRSGGELEMRGRLMGLAVALAPGDSECEQEGEWCRVQVLASDHVDVTAVPSTAAAQLPANDRPLVIDLSSLWAGPLASHLLGLAGARVIKVEDRRRPDGARRGPAAFFNLLHGKSESLALDFSDPEELDLLRQFLQIADIVIEASRPRALRQLGIDAAEMLHGNPGLCWLSITGYGREGESADWVAFGDDAAIAAGLCVWERKGQPTTSLYPTRDSRPMFCADAVADPLTGIFAALAALDTYQQGGGALLDISLVGVAGFAAGLITDTGPAVAPRVERCKGSGMWTFPLGGAEVEVARPMARMEAGDASELDADREAVLGLLSRGRAGSVGVRA